MRSNDADRASAARWTDWPRRVRWLLAAQSFGCAIGPFWPSFSMREVAVAEFDASAFGVRLRLVGAGRHAAQVVLQSAVRPPETLLERLNDWAMLHTPLLLFVGPSGEATLSGPLEALDGLRPCV